MKKLILIVSVLLIILPGFLKAQEATTMEKCIPCEKLTELKPPDVKITDAETETGVSLYCKVMGVIGKEIQFELLLPIEWNGIYNGRRRRVCRIHPERCQFKG